MNESEAEKSSPKTTDVKGKYEPPKLTVLSLDEAESTTKYTFNGSDGFSGSNYS